VDDAASVVLLVDDANVQGGSAVFDKVGSPFKLLNTRARV
jgi:hypothetical protein